MKKLILGCFTGFFFLVLLSLPYQAHASPLFSLDDFDDWDAAVNDGRISPVEENYPAAGEHYGVEGTDFIYTPPQLYVWEGDDNPGTSDAGLVMTWGDPSGPDNLPQLSAWEYLYPADPNLVGTLLSMTVFPPPGILSVSLTLNDAAGGWVSWDWNVGMTGPITPGTPYAITIDPTVLGPQAGSTSFALSAGGFNPAIAISIQADELAVGPGAWQQFPPVPVAGGQQPWNYWSSVSVAEPVPEPATMLLLGSGLIGVAAVARRRKRH